MEDLALDGAALEHAAVGRIELVEPGGEQRVDRRRHSDLAIGPSRATATISSTKSGLPPAASRMRSCSARRAGRRASASNSAVSSGASGSSSTLVAFSLPPPHAGRTSSSSGRAMQSSRIGASRLRSATCSTRSRKVGSPQCRSSKTTTTGRSAARASSSLRKAQAISSGEPEAVSSPRIDASGPVDVAVGGRAALRPPSPASS